MDIVLKRFCCNNSKIITKTTIPQVTNPNFIISKNTKDAKLKVLQLCKSMMTNVSLHYSFIIYISLIIFPVNYIWEFLEMNYIL